MSDLEEDLDDVMSMSDDSVVNEITGYSIDDGRLCYTCETNDGVSVYDRSDLIDGGVRESLVKAYERAHQIPWDEECEHCEGEGCEECICECGRPCRHIGGVNYGCVKHPVI